MGNDKAYRTIGQLIDALNATGRALGSGPVGTGDLERACEDARELYERLVVLRHKARETALAAGRAKVAEPPSADAKEEVPAIRLDTRPPDPAPRQVSIMEAIDAAVPDAPAPEKATARKATAAAPAPATKPPAKAKELPATLAEKLEKAAITDLAKAISLSHKFWFVAELFNGDRITYDKTIMRLNTMDDRASALDLVEREVVARISKPADPEALATFMELVQRRYP